MVNAKQQFQAAADIVFSGRFAYSSFPPGLLSDLVGYFSGGETSLDPTKGLYLYGQPGCGKTTLLRLFRYLCRAGADYRFAMQGVEVAEANFRVAGLMPWEPQGKPQRWAWDDIGIEPRSARYGQIKQVGEDIILQAYRWWADLGLQAHFTSNLSPAQLAGVYDQRAVSRLEQMCSLVAMPAVDLRALTGVRPDFSVFEHDGPGFFGKPTPEYIAAKQAQRAAWMEQSRREAQVGKQTKAERFQAMYDALIAAQQARRC
jgi:energy-coupling factor transporter ATP-binding protein EcfA2